jgi:hypothetical protein
MNTNPTASKLKSRREFLKSAARKAAVPIIVAYTVKRGTPTLFAGTG